MSVIRFCLLLILVGLAPCVAQAKGVSTLDAQTGWRLSSAKTPLPYCTLTQTYMDNVVLNFARNAKGERALAVDFQAQKLKAGQEIPVQISAGDIKKSFKVTPKSAQILRLQLGQDTAFEQALATARTLELRVEEEAFKIHTSEFGKELPQLETCLTALQAPPPAPEIVKAPQIVEDPLPPLLKQPPQPAPQIVAQSPPVKKTIKRVDTGVVDMTRPAPVTTPVDVVVPIAQGKDKGKDKGEDLDQMPLADVERRYAEAQKEIRRLGLAMKQAEEQHAREKRQLEEMIVDPSVQATVEDVRLKQLEEQLAASQSQIARLEQRLAMEDRTQPSRRNPIADFFSSEGGTGIWGGEPPAPPAPKKRRVDPPPPPPPSPMAAAPNAWAVDEVVLADPAPVIPPQPVAPPPAPVKAAPLPPVLAQPKLHYWQAGDIAALLRGASIAVARGVTSVPSRQADTKLFRWQAENHSGMAEQFPLADSGMFQSKVDATLARYKSGCVGQFAADRADAPEFAKGAQVQAHDVACVASGGKGAASSLLFHAKDGVMTVLVLEGTPSAMTDAMDERDALITSLMR